MEAEPSHRFVLLSLPDWARDLGVDGQILVDEACIEPDHESNREDWRRCDWIYAAYLFLSCAMEHDLERKRGPLHSYSRALSDSRVFDRAWVNRIFLFLRRWSARIAGQSELEAFGLMPDTEIGMTHDVDALRKTLEIRLKQSAFHAFNATRAIPNLAKMWGRSKAALSFAIKPARFDTFSMIRAMEEKAGLRSLLHIYGGAPGWKRMSPKSILLDPAYDVMSLQSELQLFQAGGWEIGLHQSFDAFADSGMMAAQKTRVEKALGTPIQSCRQHWLRFSLNQTWRAQEEAGFLHDSTLGFNDRAGFRNAAALVVHPWNPAVSAPRKINITPMVLMDSHFYDYAPMDAQERHDAIAHWIEEIRFVHGQATVNWHTHTITDAYGWMDGYRALLAML